MSNVVDIRTRRRGQGERCPHGRIVRACAECARVDGDRELDSHIETMREALALARRIHLLADRLPSEHPHGLLVEESRKAAAAMGHRAYSLGMGGLLNNDVGRDVIDDDKDTR